MVSHKTAAAGLLLLAGSFCQASAQDAGTPASPQHDAAAPAAAPAPAPPPLKIDILTHSIKIAADGSFRDVQHMEVESGNAALIAQLAQLPVTYDEATQALTITSAYTLKPDGKKEVVGPDGILERSAPGNNVTLSSTKQKVIVFPDVQPGDKMVFDAAVDGRPLIPGQFSMDRLIPPTLVVDQETLEVTAPKAVPLYVEAPHLSLQKKETSDTLSFSISTSNPKAAPSTDNPIGAFDWAPRFSVSTFKSYDDLSRAYAALALSKTQVTPDIQARANAIIAGTTDKREQAQKIYDWISAHVRYVAIELGVGGLVPHDAGTVLANGYGDCKDQAVLYVALLKAVKIDAQLALIHGGSTYTVAKVPTVGSFDHVITFLPQLGVYADTTTAGLVPFGILPRQDYGKPVLIVAAQSGSLKQTPVPGAKDASFTYTHTAKFDEAGHYDSNSALTATGVFMEPLRAIGKAIQLDSQGKIASDLLKARGSPRAEGGFAFSAGEAAELKANYKTPGVQVAYAQNRAFVIPDNLRLTALPSNLFFGPIFDQRYQAADAIPCQSGRGSEDETLDFPASRTLQRLPEDRKISTDHFTYTSHWSQNGNEVHVHRELEARFNQVVCTNPVKDEAMTVLQNVRGDLATQILLRPAQARRAQ